MNVTCNNCETTINVPETKIPKGQSFSFKCPSCKEKIVVPPTADVAINTKKHTRDTSTKSGSSEPKRPQSGQDLFDTARFETGTILQEAMVCHTDSKKILEITDALGISANTPKTPTEALSRLRYSEYGLVIVTEEFEKSEGGINPILEAMRMLTMQKRRKVFLVYVAPGVKSFGRLEAAAHSVNLLISIGDLGKQAKIVNAIKSGLAEHRLDYKVYNESISAIRDV